MPGVCVSAAAAASSSLGLTSPSVCFWGDAPEGKASGTCSTAATIDTQQCRAFAPSSSSPPPFRARLALLERSNPDLAQGVLFVPHKMPKDLAPRAAPHDGPCVKEDRC